MRQDDGGKLIDEAITVLISHAENDSTFPTSTSSTPEGSLKLSTIIHLREKNPIALQYAESLLDYATEQLHSVPYKDVSLPDRILYTESSLLKCIALVIEARNHERYSEEESGDASSSWTKAKCYREALKTLDMSLLMAGRPAYEDLIMSLIEAITKLLDSLGTPSTIPISDFLVQYDSAPQISHPIPTLQSPPSLITFTNHLRKNPTPLLIKNAMNHWPALSTRPWSNLSYLRTTAGASRTIPIEIGSKYTDDTWTQKLVTFGEFLDTYILDASLADAAHPQQPTAYLAQHDLFAQIPRLREDIVTPDYCYIQPNDSSDNDSDTEHEPNIITNAWFGPQGTVSPLHHDPHHNLFAQVLGRKYVRLYAPEESSRVYPHEEGTMLSNTSQVDVEAPDLNEYPMFADAKYMECVVEPGDLLFIPNDWWHYVRSLSVSFSVSFWF